MDDKAPPGAPQPFWRWGWKGASRYTRLNFIYRLAVRPLLTVAAILGALLVVIDAYPRAMTTLFWRSHEYQTLGAIHAGYDDAYARDLLGVPTQVSAVGPTGYREWIYVRRDHFVQIVSDESNRIILYSVTSCHPAFQPRFTIAGDDLTATLQDASLVETPRARDAQDDRWLFSEQNRELGYQAGETGSTPEMYWESTGGASTASNHRVWFVGVNPLCLSPQQYDDLPRGSYFGDAPSASQDAQHFRHRFAANTYAEVVDLAPAINDMGQLLLAPPGRSDYECLDEFEGGPISCGAVTVGTFSFQLAVFPKGETRVHR